MKKLSLLLLASLFCGVAGAQLLESNTEAHSEIRSLFETKLGLGVKEINQSAMPELLEVATSQGIFYVTKDGSFLVHGRLYDIGKGLENETEKTLARLRVEGVHAFADSAITFPAENEKFRITVFTDITCTYCRRLHSQIEQYNALGITIDYMAFPRYGTEHESFQDLQSIWCSENPRNAMTAAKAGRAVSPKSCDNKLKQQYAFAQSVGVNSTPAIVTENGTLIPGYQPPEQLLQALQRAK